MSLDKILRRKRLTILGLNSGTSADGLDLAVVRITSTGNKRSIKFISGGKRAYSPVLRRKLLELADARLSALDELIYLDNLLGRFCGRASASFVSKLPVGIKVDLIASHGQTVRHLPEKKRWVGEKVRGTLQIGSADFIAAATGKTVVSDFRQADVALGNEGAPITVSAMREMFASASQPRLIVNIGGISNYFYFASVSGLVKASDCGPGNCLCDILSKKLNNEPYDRGGRRARRGEISKPIVSRMMSGGFYRGNLVSTGREAFGIEAADKILAMANRRRLTGDDVMATASELTVKSIVRIVTSVVSKDKRLLKLYLTGGGRYNMFFVERLKYYLPDLDIVSVDALGIDGDYVEAAAYAVMGEACLRSRGLETDFGSRSKQLLRPVLGKITQPPQRSRRT